MEEYDYTLKYTPGKDTMVADMISRYPTINVNQRSIEELTTIDDLNDFPLNFVTISSHQKNDKQFQSNLHKNSSLYIKYINDTRLFSIRTKHFSLQVCYNPLSHGIMKTLIIQVS